jgi:hypothetical protein
MLKVKLHKSWKTYFNDSDMDKIRDAIKYSIKYHKIGEINHTVEFYFVDEITSSRSLGMNEFTA